MTQRQDEPPQDPRVCRSRIQARQSGETPAPAVAAPYHYCRRCIKAAPAEDAGRPPPSRCRTTKATRSASRSHSSVARYGRRRSSPPVRPSRARRHRADAEPPGTPERPRRAPAAPKDAPAETDDSTYLLKTLEMLSRSRPGRQAAAVVTDIRTTAGTAI
jgi:hypothetical protein